MTARRSTAAPILAGAFLVLPFVLYVGGYFWLCEWRDLGPVGVGQPQLTFRVYGSEWQAKLFQPASRTESFVTGRVVRIGVKG